MYSLIPDIQYNAGEGLLLPTTKAEKATPMTGSGKAYKVLPSVGDSQPSLRQSDCTRARLNPSIQPLREAPAQPRLPLACLDQEQIQKKIIKAEKKEKKRKKKTTKPSPQPDNSQVVHSGPEVPIPHPPTYPLDPTLARRIVRIRQTAGIRYVDVQQYIAYATAGYWP
jgi:hypothetical protein